MPTQVATLTIGQTPRTDIIREISAVLPHPVEFHEYGLLDALSRKEIKRLEPVEDEARVCTRPY